MKNFKKHEMEVINFSQGDVFNDVVTSEIETPEENASVGSEYM